MVADKWGAVITMQSTVSQDFSPTVQIPVMTVAELQDSLMIVMNDLHRLEGLISHAAENLLDRFTVANQGIAAVKRDPVNTASDLQQIGHALQSAVTELQFQDIPTRCSKVALTAWRAKPWSWRRMRCR